jgi:hypothetical protein
MRTFLSKNPTSGKRTAKTQAEEVLAGRSWTCNSSHVADAARHVGPKLNGKPFSTMSPLKKAVSAEDYDKFVEIYSAAMQRQGLRNFLKGADFLPDSKDPLHMELPDSRLPADDPAVLECKRLMEEGRVVYAKRRELMRSPRTRSSRRTMKTGSKLGTKSIRSRARINRGCGRGGCT